MTKRLTDTFEFNRWLFVSRWDVILRGITDLPAIYAIYVDQELVYIGQTNTPRFRFTQHGFKSGLGETVITPWGEFSGVYAKIKYPREYGREAMIEKRLIKRLKPRFNKYHYKTSRYTSLG